MAVPPRINQQVTFLYCADLEVTTSFYRDRLHLPVVLDQGVCRIFRAGRDAFIGFCQGTGNLSPPTATGLILTLVVNDRETVDTWYTYLRESDCAERIEKAPTLNQRFAIYHLFLRDPDGYLLEIQAFLDPKWPRTINGKDNYD
jgi:catechol 2,3-dioxygenase-like lactoylglutathione lyase family enzyme